MYAIATRAFPYAEPVIKGAFGYLVKDNPTSDSIEGNALSCLCVVQPILAGIAISIAITSVIPAILFTALDLTLIAIFLKNKNFKILGKKIEDILGFYFIACTIINSVAQGFFVYANPSVYNVGATIAGYGLLGYGAFKVMKS